MNDRLSLIIKLIDDYIIQHPVCKLEKTVVRPVEEAQHLLLSANQEAIKLEQEHLKKTHNE